MDDMYLIHESREYLKECLKIITELCAKLKIAVNMKKTRIVKLKDGMDFLKGKYVLLESGKILRLPGKDSAKRMRRKLKKFKTLADAGEMGWDDLRCAYQSWRGNYRRRFTTCYRVRNMDRLYRGLFMENIPTGGNDGLLLEKERAGLSPRGGKQSRRDEGGEADGRPFGTAGSRGDGAGVCRKARRAPGVAGGNPPVGNGVMNMKNPALPEIK
jgi:hypothetical protein